MTAFNAFQIFNMPVSFKIDEAELGQKYFQIQKMVHPDRFASASEAEKRNAQQWSTRLNDAYSVLKDPIQRAKLVCALLGSPVDEESSGSINEEFLMDQLIRREEISTAKEANDETRLKKLKEEISGEKEDLLKKVEHSLDEDKDPKTASENIKIIMFLARQLEDLK